MRLLYLPFRFLLILWALPWTLVGVLVGCVGLCTGGRVQRRRGIVEFYGGAVTRALERFPGGPSAMTLGHTVLGQTPDILDTARDHELIHVRQYERWGPLFVPVYLACSLFLWIAGGDPYRDNPFEREAFGDVSSSVRSAAPRESSWLDKFRVAVIGIALGVRGQSSFVVHLAMAALVVLAAAVLRVGLVEWLLLLLCITIVLAAEMFNSSIEWLARTITDDYDERIGRALDIASGAVLVASLGAALVGVVVFGHRIGVLAGWWTSLI